jgi:hypothetical protein
VKREKKTNAARASHPSRIVIADAFLLPSSPWDSPKEKSIALWGSVKYPVPRDQSFFQEFQLRTLEHGSAHSNCMREHGSRKNDFQETPFGDAHLKLASQVGNSALRSALRAGGRDVSQNLEGGYRRRPQRPGTSPLDTSWKFPQRFTLERIASNA